MRRLSCLALALVMVVPGLIVSARAEHIIALYSDPAHTSTEAPDEAPATLTIYVVLESTTGGTAAYFRINPTPGFTGAWVGETTPFLHMGTSQTGIGLSFQPGCIMTAEVLQIQYALLGTSENCSILEIVANPQYDLFGGSAVVIDCVFEDRPALGGQLTINPDPSCTPVPVSPTTWGQIKAMYR